MATDTIPPDRSGADEARASLGPRHGRLSWAAIIVGVSVSLGAALRLRHFAANRSLWLDEALLANALIGRPFGAILQPLEASQAAPLGYLAALRASIALLGPGELALRLSSLVAGLLALPVWLLGAEGLAFLHQLARPHALWLVPTAGLLLLAGMLGELDSLGRQIDRIRRPDASAYLYVLPLPAR